MKNSALSLLGSALIIAGLAIGCSEPNTTVNSKPRTDTILINSMKFTPDKATVRLGDTLLWINKDFVAHNVKETRHNIFYSDTLPPGKSFKWIVTGKADYICSIHPTMEGKVTIIKQ